jgi:hypothetical protein
MDYYLSGFMKYTRTWYLGLGMLGALVAVLHHACRNIRRELPCARTSIVSGVDGMHCFRKGDVKVIVVCPRLHNGARAPCIDLTDVRLTVTDASAAKPVRVRVQAQLDVRDGSIQLQFEFEASVQLFVLEKLCVRVHVCGALLTQFHGRTSAKLCSQHVVKSESYFMAICPDGTRLAVSSPSKNTVSLYALPDMQFLSTFDRTELHSPLGLCFSDDRTLLIADHRNDRVQRWALDGAQLASYAAQSPRCVASRDDTLVIGCSQGVRVLSLKSGVVLHDWKDESFIAAVAVVNATTLAVAIREVIRVDAGYVHGAVGLYALDGTLFMHVARDISSFGLATCANDCLLVSDYNQGRIHVFSLDGRKLDVPLAECRFKDEPWSIAVSKECVYVLELSLGLTPTINVFK